MPRTVRLRSGLFRVGTSAADASAAFFHWCCSGQLQWRGWGVHNLQTGLGSGEPNLVKASAYLPDWVIDRERVRICDRLVPQEYFDG